MLLLLRRYEATRRRSRVLLSPMPRFRVQDQKKATGIRVYHFQKGLEDKSGTPNQAKKMNPYITSESQKKIPSAVLYYYCAWYPFLRNGRQIGGLHVYQYLYKVYTWVHILWQALLIVIYHSAQQIAICTQGKRDRNQEN